LPAYERNHVVQRKELAELFGFETRSKYAIEADCVPFAFAAEQGKGDRAFLARMFHGHYRTFEIHFFRRRALARVPRALLRRGAVHSRTGAARREARFTANQPASTGWAPRGSVTARTKPG
jgi:hypothetical protein